MFGDIFHNLPRLNSDFLNTSWQTSRNIAAPQSLLKGFRSPSSSPKPQSVISPTPPLSPKSPAKSPHSPILSSKPSSPRSQSSSTFQIRPSNTTVSSRPESKELPSPLLSPKSLIRRSTNVPVPASKIGRRRMQGVAAAKKALIKKKSPVSPEEPCSPIRPSSGTSCEKDSSQQTGICNL